MDSIKSTNNTENRSRIKRLLCCISVVLFIAFVILLLFFIDSATLIVCHGCNANMNSLEFSINALRLSLMADSWKIFEINVWLVLILVTVNKLQYMWRRYSWCTHAIFSMSPSNVCVRNSLLIWVRTCGVAALRCFYYHYHWKRDKEKPVHIGQWRWRAAL